MSSQACLERAARFWCPPHDPNGQEAQASGLSIFLPGPQTPSSVDDTTGFDPQWTNLGLAKVAPNWAAFLQAQQQ